MYGGFPLSENSLSGSLGYVTTPRQKANKQILFLESDEFTCVILTMHLTSDVGVEVVVRARAESRFDCK